MTSSTRSIHSAQAPTGDTRSGHGRVVLAYPGGPGSLQALRTLIARGLEVVTVTVDLGEETDLDEVREQARSAGALRAHVLDAREEFARDCLLPALRTQPVDDLDPPALAAPLIRRKLAEIAVIERATLLDADGGRLSTSGDGRGGRTLVERSVSDVARLKGTPAHVDLEIRGLVPVAINGVPMAIGELFECLALIAGHHGVGHLRHLDAPAVPLLHAAYAALDGRDGVVRFQLLDGALTIEANEAGVDHSDPELVNHT